MSYAIIYRTLWKEYRTLRGFWMALLVIGLLFQWVLLVAAGATPQLAAVALVVTALYALGCGATAFAVEREEGTIDLLRQLPTHGSDIVWGKVAFALGSTAALLATLLLPGGLIFWRSGIEIDSEAAWFGAISGPLMFLEALAWGTFFSLVVRRPVVAAVLGVTAASVSLSMLGAVVGESQHVFSGEEHPLVLESLIPLRVAVVIGVSLACVPLVPRWYQGRRRHTPETSTAESTTGKQVVHPGTAPRAWWALCWQQARQLRSVWLATPLLIAAVALGFTLDAPSATLLYATLAATVVGGTAFQADQDREQYRFLAERPVSPGLVWWSRQGATLLVTLLIVGVFAGVVVFWLPWDRGAVSSWEAVTIGALVFLLAYASGQWWSIVVRGNLMVVALALATTMLLSGWAMLMLMGMVPWWWSVVPLPLALLLSTRLRTKGWLLERGGAEAWLIPALPLVAAATILPGAAAAYRVFSIPLVDPGFDVAAYRRPPSAEERAVGEIYAAAAKVLSEHRMPQSSGPRSEELEAAPEEMLGPYHAAEIEPLWQPPTPEQLAWLDRNRPALDLALQAADRESCWLATDVDLGGLIQLVQLDGLRLQEQGNLDEAWRRYLAAMRMLEHWVQGAPSSWNWYSLQLRRSEVMEAMVGWTAAGGESPERLAAAMADYRAAQDRIVGYAETLKAEYIRFEKLLDGDPATMHALRLDRRTVRSLAVARILLFWEVARARRVARYYTASHLQRVEQIEGILDGRQPHPGSSNALLKEVIEPPRFVADIDQRLWLGFFSTPWWDPTVQFEADHRATLVRMAIAAWKLEHDKLPDQLEDLTARYLDSLPLNPWTGEEIIYLPEGLPMPYGSNRQIVPAETPLLWMPSVAGQTVEEGLPLDHSRRRSANIYPIP